MGPLDAKAATARLGRLRPRDGLELLKKLEAQGEANVFHYNALLSGFAKVTSWQRALAFLDQMNQKDVQKDTISFNACIRAAAVAKRWQTAVELLEVMQDESLRSDTISFNSAISACSEVWPMTLHLLGAMQRRSVPRSTVTWNSLLASGASAGACRGALVEWVLGAMEAEALQKDVITFGSAIHGCGNWQRAIGFLSEMETQQVEVNLIARNAAITSCSEASALSAALRLEPVDAVGFNSAITACGGEWATAISLMAQMRCQELRLEVITFNAAITACDEAKNWMKSFELFREMAGESLKANTRTYAALIHSCTICDFLWPEALSLLQDMAKEGVEVNTMTYNSAISACEKGCAWRSALHLFAQLDERSHVSYGALAKALEQAGRWMEVLDLLVAMVLASLPPDVVASSAAISALAKGHVWTEAMQVLEEMLDYELAVPSIAVSSAFSACERRAVPAAARPRHFGGGEDATT